MTPEVASLSATILGALLLNLFPFAAGAVVTQATASSRKLGVIGSFLVTILLALWLDPSLSDVIIAIALRALYYCSVTYWLLWLVCVRAVRFTAPALLALCLLLFVLFPAILEPRFEHVAFTVVAWEIALSAYSACEAASRSPTLARSELAYFILVNPVLTYSTRGKAVATHTSAWRSAARALGGAVALALGCATVAATDSAVWSHVPPQIPSSIPMAPWLFVAHYAMHSGRGALGVSFMRLLGTDIPERYHYPLASRSPSEFWRRWNIYIGEWALRYLFIPVSRAAPASLKSRSGLVAWQLLALLTTMAAIGFIHDLGDFSASFLPTIRGLRGFLAFGLVTVIWHVAEVGLRQANLRLQVRPHTRRMVGVIAHGGFLLALFGSVAVFWS